VGLLVGILAAYFGMRGKGNKQEEFDRSKLVAEKTSVPPPERPMSASSSNTRPTLSYMDGSNASASNLRVNRTGRTAPSQYQVEALVLPGESGSHQPTETVMSHSHSEADYPAPSNQVYVVHHDSGRPPVTVYTGSGAEVVELPPSYLANSGRQRSRTNSGPSGARPNLSQRRTVAPIQKKTLVESQTYTREPPT
jgi:hypothetical protein